MRMAVARAAPLSFDFARDRFTDANLDDFSFAINIELLLRR
jgi:hypothetical protein